MRNGVVATWRPRICLQQMLIFLWCVFQNDVDLTWVFIAVICHLLPPFVNFLRGFSHSESYVMDPTLRDEFLFVFLLENSEFFYGVYFTETLTHCIVPRLWRWQIRTNVLFCTRYCVTANLSCKRCKIQIEKRGNE